MSSHVKPTHGRRFHPEEKKRKMLEAVIAFSEGYSCADIAFAADVSISTIDRWRLEDADFDRRCRIARDEGVVLEEDEEY